MFLESRIPRFTPRAFFIHPPGAKSVFFGIRVERHVLNSVSPSRRFERPVLNGTKVIVSGIRSRLPRSALPYPSWLNVLLPLPQLFPSAASAAFCFTMVTRLVKRAKFICWRVDFAKKNREKTWKHTLNAVVVGGRANVTSRDVSLHMVELAWPKAVTYDSAARLVRFAKEKDASLDILSVPLLENQGEPIGIADAVVAADEAASAALTGIADAARGALVAAAAAAPDDAAASE